MLKKVIIIIIIIAAVAAFGTAIPVRTIEARSSVDKKTALIGQTVTYSLEIVAKKGIEAEPVAIEDALKKFTIKSSERLTKPGLFKDRSIFIFKITDYEPAFLTIVPVRIRYRSRGETVWKEIETNACTVTVESLLATEPVLKPEIKTGGALVGPKGTQTLGPEREKQFSPANLSSYAIRDSVPPKEPVTAKDVIFKILLWAIGVIIVLVIFTVTLSLYITSKENKVPLPHVEALTALRALNADVHEERIGAKEFYSRLISVVAAYFIARFSLEKSEMTKTEILASLENIPETGGRAREIVARLLLAAESVRYFDRSAGRDEMIRDIEAAKEIIALTK